MNRSRARAYLLTEILGLLPVIIVISAITVQLISRSLRAQALARAYEQDAMQMRRIAERIRADAAHSNAAHVERTADATLLRLTGAEHEAVYRVDGSEVTRTMGPADSGHDETVWKLGSVDVDFEIETMGSGTQLVWMRFTRHTPVTIEFTRKRGARDLTLREERLATVAIVGGSGAP